MIGLQVGKEVCCCFGGVGRARDVNDEMFVPMKDPRKSILVLFNVVHRF